jgi:MoxR-like ATPase
VTSFQESFGTIERNVNSFVRGQKRVVNLALVCLFAEGHLLIEGNPGTAKTSLARAIAVSITGAEVKRIQFTPDLLPADVTGSEIYRGETFEFIEGPVFTNILLGDEINRASPKTQSALLEAMAERQVTSGMKTYPLPEPFMVIATQNPIEHHGIYPLPEAQLDRFMMRLRMDDLERNAEIEVVLRSAKREPLTDLLGPVLPLAEVLNLIEQVRAVHVGPAAAGYIVDLVGNTRAQNNDIELGASTRAAVALTAAAQSYAAMSGRTAVTSDDVYAVAPAVLSHRLIMRSDAKHGADLAVDEIRKAMHSPENAAPRGRR